MKKTFKDFLNARHQLTERCSINPLVDVQYKVRKYTKIMLQRVGVNESVNVKPKDVIKIEWICDTNGNVTDIKNITINNQIYETDKSIENIKKWLGTNTLLDDTNWFVN